MRHFVADGSIFADTHRIEATTSRRMRMSVTATIVSVLLAQAAPVIPSDTTVTTSDVAYTELSGGQSDAALRKLESAPGVKSGDPATLINLGVAYARAGMADKAIAAYRAAAESQTRYDLELADGTWMDSRSAARTALSRLKSAQAQALRN